MLNWLKLFWLKLRRQSYATVPALNLWIGQWGSCEASSRSSLKERDQPLTGLYEPKPSLIRFSVVWLVLLEEAAEQWQTRLRSEVKLLQLSLRQNWNGVIEIFALAKCCDVVIGLCCYSSIESFDWNTWFLLFTEDFQWQSIRTVEPAVTMLLCFTWQHCLSLSLCHSWCLGQSSHEGHAARLVWRCNTWSVIICTWFFLTVLLKRQQWQEDKKSHRLGGNIMVLFWWKILGVTQPGIFTCCLVRPGVTARSL